MSKTYKRKDKYDKYDEYEEFEDHYEHLSEKRLRAALRSKNKDQLYNLYGEE